MKLLILFACVAVAFAIPEGFKKGKTLGEEILEKKGLAESKGQADGDMHEGDMRMPKSSSGGSDRNMITGDQYRWPKQNGIVYVPYEFDSSTIPEAKRQALEAMKDYAKYTCIKWVPRSRESDYISFFRSSGCWSYVGKQGGKQQLSLGDGCQYDKGTPTHEMMHALGFQHEQSRSDRDRYVQIVKENVDPNNLYNFDVCPDTKCTLPRAAYDFDSVMHYEAWAFSTNKKDTIVPRNANSDVKLGQRKGLSKLDVDKLNEMYKCGGKTVERFNNGGKFPADELVDGWSSCPQYKGQCTDPSNNYQVKRICEKTCAGAQKGGSYDKYSNCADYKPYCNDRNNAWVAEECPVTCGH